jgi:hypothetical protein
MTADTTQKTRQQRRRKALNELAQKAGFESWSAFETSVLNGKTCLTQREPDRGKAVKKKRSGK